MFRPQEFTGSSDYVIVHGMINTEGRFDQLAMVFPDEFEQKDLLIKSLKLWSFRPASRDRQPTEVKNHKKKPTETKKIRVLLKNKSNKTNRCHRIGIQIHENCSASAQQKLISDDLALEKSTTATATL